MGREFGWHPDRVMEEFSLDDMKEFIAINIIETEDYEARMKEHERHKDSE